MKYLVPILCCLSLLSCEKLELESSQFTLKFEYGARVNYPLVGNKGIVIWNDENIYSINPTDYNIRLITLTVFAKIGKNTLQFQGNGIYNNKAGITIDNVELIKKGTTNNVIINGDFEVPKLSSMLQYRKQILGWKSDLFVQIGRGSLYNPGWNTQIAELNADYNTIITQEINFDSYYDLISPQKTPLMLKLEIDWTHRQLYPLETSQGTILFNGKILGSLIPKPNPLGINYVVYDVQLLLGDNILTIDGNSLSDGYGISIGYVKLFRPHKDENLIKNSDFSDPVVPKLQLRHIKGGISNWLGTNLQIGDCKIYNKRWRGGQCIELDSDKNQRYSQIIKVDWGLYKKLRDNLALDK